MNNGSVYINEILSKRLKLVTSIKENESEGLFELLSEFYPDQAHFVYELLQNAEDAGASAVKFILEPDKLTFCHDSCRLFEKDDVNAITNIGKSNKKTNVNAIGKFGIGFKSVFAYTDTPSIYSGEYSFEIRDLVCPYPTDSVEFFNNTKFVFPFNHHNKDKSRCFEEIKSTLVDLEDNVLLFLRNIQLIEWNISNEGTGYVLKQSVNNSSPNHFEIVRENTIDESIRTSHWLIFEREYLHAEKEFPTGLAFLLDYKKNRKDSLPLQFDSKIGISKQMHIIPVDNTNQKGKLFVYFPCIKETTKLNFHINGPFKSTKDRASIIHDEDNKAIINAIAKLLIDSLETIKTMDLLNRDFIEVLPNSNDSIEPFYLPIFNDLICTMKEQPYVPTLDKTIPFAPANSLINSYQEVKDFIDSDFLRLINEDREYENKVIWVDGTMYGGGKREERREEYFLSDLEITKLDWDTLLSNIVSTFNSKSDTTQDWLSRKDDEWIKKFYLFFQTVISKSTDIFYKASVHECYIVRTQTNEHRRGSEVFYPTEKNNSLVLQSDKIKNELLNLNDSNQEAKLFEFFNLLKVKQLNLEEEVKLILNSYYKYNSDEPKTDTQHINHIKKFISLWKTNRSLSWLFKHYHIFKEKHNKSYKLPGNLYLDKPYKKTNLSLLINKDETEKFLLWAGYHSAKLSKESFLEFALAVGINDKLKIKERTIPNSHPDIQQLKCPVFASKTSYSIDKDYYIENLDSLLNQKSKPICKIIWDTMNCADRDVLEACYRPNKSYSTRTKPSSLVYKLRNTAWIPGKDGNFYLPCSMTRELLPKDFDYDSSKAWLKAIGFGEEYEKRREEHIKLHENLKAIGLDEESYREYLKFIEIPKETRSKFLNKNIVKFPEKPTHNPERRGNKVKEKMCNAEKKEYKIRERSVRISNINLKESVRTYLRNSYTNEDNELICQICHKVMPFKLGRGDYYFEAVEFYNETEFEIEENYLTLCPTCAAKFLHANSSKKKMIKEFLNSENPEITITLAGEDHILRFVESHYLDLKTALNEVVNLD